MHSSRPQVAVLPQFLSEPAPHIWNGQLAPVVQAFVHAAPGAQMVWQSLPATQRTVQSEPAWQVTLQEEGGLSQLTVHTSPARQIALHVPAPAQSRLQGLPVQVGVHDAWP
jgi:hypothetical protein